MFRKIIRLIYVILLVFLLSQCRSIETCTTLEEELTKAKEKIPFPPSYHLINQNSFPLQFIISFNQESEQNRTQILSTNDTSNSINSIVSDLVDSVELVFNLNSKHCLKYKGQIEDSLTDIRSTLAYKLDIRAAFAYQKNPVVFKEEGFLISISKKLLFLIKRGISKHSNNLADCPAIGIGITAYVIIDSTHLNQATEEACTN